MGMTFGNKVEINNLINFEKILKERGKTERLDYHNLVSDIFRKIIDEDYESSYVYDDDIILNDVRSYEEGVLCALSVNYSEFVRVAFTHDLNHAKIIDFRGFIDEYLSDLVR